MAETKGMLRSVSDMMGFGIVAQDGEIGRVSDLYFDDSKWTIRYLVLDTGGWLSGRQVLISPVAFEGVDWGDKKVHLNLTRQQIEDSPGIEEDRPVSKQFEEDYFRYYGWSPYWVGPASWGVGMYPYQAPTAIGPARVEIEREAPGSEESGDRHLRSAKEVMGYGIKGSDDGIGNVTDFIMNDRTWEIRWMVVDTSPWWFGGEVLIHPGSIGEIAWDARTVFVNLTRDQVKNSPKWEKDRTVSEDYDDQLTEYYSRGSRAA